MRKLKAKGGADASKPDWFNIGFNKVGTRNVMDIEVSVVCEADARYPNLP